MALKKTTLENYQSAFPDIIQTIGEYLKSLVSKDNLDTLSASTGTAATIIKLFSKPIIDKAFQEYAKNQLKGFGLETYLKTSIECANECVETSLREKDIRLSDDVENEIMKKSLPTIIQNQVDDLKVDPILIFQPKFHPIVILIKNIYSDLLSANYSDESIKNQFLKEFNGIISEKIRLAFGDNYEKHLVEAKAEHQNEKEAKILMDIIQNAKIGFDDKEKLSYVETYGSWQEIAYLDSASGSFQQKQEDLIKYEQKLEKVSALIDQYFDLDPDKTIEKILFMVADFGKGKSVFLRNYAASLAKKYLVDSDGYFPIYFNLRDFSRYQSESKNGIIYEAIETIYGIKLDDEYFKQKKYLFLVDSLDESGELTKANIDKIINSIKRIQNIDKSLCRENRIVVTSRPFDNGLKNQLLSHQPYQMTTRDGRKQVMYISLYGFKKEQFNVWLTNLLLENKSFLELSKTAFNRQLIDDIKTKQTADIHSILSNRRTLSYEELKRPIFGYMIYQLIINDYDFIKVGKIGVYLSFINLLSKEAKYIHDKDYRFNLIEQIECRNILHTIASLWAHERVSGNQGSLKKADVCRAIEGDLIDTDDDRVLERFSGRGITEISFLSHSYFGENGSIFHFQHQSFAEILLAEYYLKVLIKYSLERSPNVNEARKKLFVGYPSAQTLEFLKGLLTIFRDACSDSNTEEILEKRQLLFPFVASIAIDKYNKELSSDVLFYNWLKPNEWRNNSSQPPKRLLDEWFFGNENLKKIELLCKNIIEDDSYELLISESTREKAIYKNELTKLKSEDLNVRYLDKLLCMFSGNILFNNIKSDYFFMRQIATSTLKTLLGRLLSRSNNLFQGFKNECFLGLLLQGDIFDASGLDLSHIDFSYSHIGLAKFRDTVLRFTNFSNVTFENVDFSTTDIRNAKFENAKFEGMALFALCIIEQGVFFPYGIVSIIHEHTNARVESENEALNFIFLYANFGADTTFIDDTAIEGISSFFEIVKYFIHVKSILTIQQVTESFILDKEGKTRMAGYLSL